MSEETGYEGLDAPLDAGAEDTTGSDQKVHPAYEKLLAEIPQAWHDKVIPHLQEQDRAVQQQLEKYTPYKEYVDNGVDPAFIQQSIQLAQAIAEDPVTIHQNLTKALMSQGLIREEAEAQAEELMDDAFSDYAEEGLPESVKRELAARDEKINSFEDYIYEQEMEQATYEELDIIEAELDGLRDTYEVTEAQENAILELMEAAVARGEDMSVVDAARKLVSITGVGFKRYSDSDLSGDAPVVLGATGNAVPFEGVNIPKDDKGKKEMMAQLFAQQYGNR